MKGFIYFISLYLGIVAMGLGAVLLSKHCYPSAIISYILGFTSLLTFWVYLQKQIRGSTK